MQLGISRQDVEDAMSSATLESLRYFDTFHGSTADEFTKWFAACARNCLVRTALKEARYATEPIERLDEEGVTTESPEMDNRIYTQWLGESMGTGVVDDNGYSSVKPLPQIRKQKKPYVQHISLKPGAIRPEGSRSQILYDILNATGRMESNVLRHVFKKALVENKYAPLFNWKDFSIIVLEA